MAKQTIQVADKPTLDEIKALLENNVADKTTNDAIKSLLENTTYGLDAIKKSVSDGKTLVANAITGKGVATTNNATFQTMASNINSIATGSKITIDGKEFKGDLNLKTKLTYCYNYDYKLDIYPEGNSVNTAIYYRGELYYFIDSDKVYKTDKEFSTLTKISSPTFNNYIDKACVYNDCIYVTTNYTPTDFYKYNGSTWTKLVNPNSCINRIFSSDRYLYCIAYKDGNSIDYGFYRYDGTTWTSIGSFGRYADHKPNKAISRENSDDIYELNGYYSRVYKWNGGTTWTLVIPSAPVSSFENNIFIDEDNFHGFADDYHYYYDGTSWKSLEIPSYNVYSRMMAVNYNYGLNVGIYYDRSPSTPRNYLMPHSVISHVIES